MSVSVIIPTFNRSELLRNSIQSVLDQTISPTEIIVVDDHSTDDTSEVVGSFKNEKIKYVLNRFKKGANGARNTGILLAECDFIAFQDSDDIWLPSKLEEQLNYMNSNPEVDMCFCSLNLNKGLRVIPNREVRPSEVKSQLRKGNFISTQTIFLKREVAISTMFDEDLMRFQDWDFCLRISNQYSIHHLPKPLVMVEHQNDSISKKVNGVKALNQLFTKHPELTKEIIIKALYNYEKFSEKMRKNKRVSALSNYFLYSIYKIIDKLFVRDSKL
ncbi:glycosyltransferase involved in cell wall biosynthesis [Salirhabdus euzebyi]|uniref:Glycosyltransferase involved in cell wall biosynthesis n=1 Tax=Salirhabdus euzebyi TaxID=394506 RepID=A0A841Q6F6_9BACI|nr:glycosyltransferase family A protein [Salirhabdus euzebyi]MBB6453996.1 glycosyltransferase involved in cell wall biosynthesis [Salirhabdus euzebyi]